MKLIRWLLIFAFAAPLMAQNTRFDLPITTVQAQGGNLLPLYAIPGAGIKFYSCSGSVCTTLATTYISATSSTTCPVSPTPMQVTLNGRSTCVSTADPYGNMGAWFQAGQYMATITAQGGSYNYYFTIGVGGSGGGSGTLGYLAKFGPTTTTIGNSHIDDGATTASTITATEPVVIATGGGVAGSATIGHGTAPAGVAGSAILTSDSTNGYLEINENNTGLSRVCTAGNGVCSSGGSVSVNGTSVSSPNFNDTTPSAASNNINVAWQHSSSSVSAEVQYGTNSVKGVLQTDGSTINNSSGVISCATATTSQLGCVKPDGSTITISGGVISAVGGGGGGGGGSQFFTGSVAGTSPQAYTLVSSVAGGTMYKICSAWTFLTSSGTVTGESMVVTWTSAQTVNTTETFSVPEFNTSNVVQPTCTTIYAQTGTAITLNLTFSGGGSILTGNYYSTVDTGGGGDIAKSPYIEIGSTLYLPQDGMYAVTLPPSSPVWINSVAPGTITNGTNGDILYTTAGTNTFYWEEQSGTSKVESALQCLSANSSSGAAACGVWLYDSTNSLIYTIVEAINTGTGNGESVEIDSFSYSGSGNPSSGVRVATVVSGFNGWASQYAHMRIIKSGSSLLFQISPNGGQNFFTEFTQTGIGTIADGGVDLLDGGSFPAMVNVASEVVQ